MLRRIVSAIKSFVAQTARGGRLTASEEHERRWRPMRTKSFPKRADRLAARKRQRQAKRRGRRST